MARLPFWMHQLLEYVIGIGLIFQATQGASMAPAALAGAALLIVAATVEGPLGAWHAMSRPSHRLVDVVVIVVMAVLAAVPGTGIDGLARAALGMGALLLAVLLVWTDYAPKRPRQPLPDGEALGRAAGRAVGRGIQSYRRRDRR